MKKVLDIIVGHAISLHTTLLAQWDKYHKTLTSSTS